MIYLCTRKTETECSAVGSALRSGRRGRAFESPHSDRERQAVKIACRFLPSQTAVKAQLIWLSLKTWLLYWSESYKHLHCSGKFHPKKGFLQCFQDKGGSHAHIRADPGSGNHWFSPCIVYEESALYTITFCKHTDAHRSRFNLLLLKKKRTQNWAVYRQIRINPSHSWRFHWKTCQAIYVYEHEDKWRDHE